MNAFPELTNGETMFTIPYENSRPARGGAPRPFGPAAIAVAVAITLMLALTTVGARAADDNPSGRPLPRFVSLKSDRVNVRKGPGLQYPIAWVFRRFALPLEIIKEHGHWRQIRDSEGATGWIHRRLLSTRRTALVMPWGDNRDEPVALTQSASSGSGTSVLVQPRAIVDIIACDGTWCDVEIRDFEGWLTQNKLWGVYENERLP